MIYVYDDSFYGFLTVVHAHYYEQPATEIYSRQNYKGSLLEQPIYLATDPLKAAKVEKALRQKCSTETYYNIYYTFLAADRLKDYYLLRYIVAAFKMGKQIDHFYSTKEVLKVQELSKKVGREKHRYLGALRFREIGAGTDVVLYAVLEPDNDILVLLGPHFSNRYHSERMIIHDISRKQALLAHKGKWLIRDFEWESEIQLSEQEDMFQKLWKGYFEHIAIPNRKNKALQRSMLPYKYRTHMIEFD